MNNIVFFYLENISYVLIPLFLVTLGALFTARISILNVAIEGLLALGAFSGCVVTGLTGSLIAGLFVGAIVCAIFSSLIAISKNYLGTNPFITGLALNFLLPGIISVLMQVWFNSEGFIRFQNFPHSPHFFIGVQKNIFDAFFSGFDEVLLLCFVVAIIAMIFLDSTKTGIRIKALGSNQEVLFNTGLYSFKYKLTAFIMCGILVGIAGCLLSFQIGAYIPGSSAGRGWIALVLVYVGGKNTIGVFLSSFGFATMLLLTNIFQKNALISQELALIVPFVIAFVIYIVERALSTQQEIK